VAQAVASASASASDDVGPAAAPRTEADAGRRRDAGASGLARWDKDGDGRITREEAPARLKKRFDKLDTNHDGALDAEEMKAARGPGKGHGKGHHGKGKGHGDGGHAAPAHPAEDTEEP